MKRMLGLFPAFQTVNAGGIQVAGRLAWDALEQELGRNAVTLLQVDLTDSAPARDETVTRTRLSAVLRAVRLRRAETVLCWHAGLLPLATLTKAQQTALFLHGIEVWRRPNPLQAIALRGVNRIIANSAHTLERARSFGFVPAHAKTSVVHLGIGAPANVIMPPHLTPAVVMVGRLDRSERYKGHEEVIRAWPMVRSRVPNAQLWIAGDGNLRGELQRLVGTLGMRDQIIFYGRISEERKQTMLAHARCMALPSRAEGFGLVYIEAMRLGRPCLVSNSDAGQEVVHPPECGLAVDPKDHAAMADAITRLLLDGPEWESWSANALKRYAGHYTATAFQQRLLAALEA